MGKFLRKIMLLFVVAVFSVSLTAQNKLSVNLGYLNSNTTLKSSMTGIQLSTELPSNGFVVGAAYDYVCQFAWRQSRVGLCSYFWQ